MGLSSRFVVMFYGVMGLLGWALASLWLDLSPVDWGDPRAFDEGGVVGHPLFGLGAGACVGLACVLISQVLDRTTTWARRLGEAFQDLLGELGGWQIFVIAASSSVGEELLFRGFLQQALALRWLEGWSGPWSAPLAIGLSGLVFGLLHMGPDVRTFFPWTIMAVVMGGVFGALFWWTGGLEAPIVAHFTINYLNLTLMQSGARA